MPLFDSADIDAADRLDAVRDLLRSATHPASFGPTERGGLDGLRLRAWGLGGGAIIFHTDGPGLYMRRKQARDFPVDESLVCLSVQSSGRARLVQGEHRYALRSGSLWLTDMSDSYDYALTGQGCSLTYQVDMETLGFAPSDIAAAAARLTASPLYPLVRDHLVSLTEYVKTDGPISSELSYATSDLIRGLVISVLGDAPRLPRLADDQALWDELTTFLRRHLRDPMLDEPTVARALGIPLRQLRRLAEARGVCVTVMITSRRLDGACRELDATRAADRSAVSTARRWGFASPGQLLRMLADSGYDITST